MNITRIRHLGFPNRKQQIKTIPFLFSFLAALFLVSACSAASKEPVVTSGGGTASSTAASTITKPADGGDALLLRSFCGDPEVDAFFDSLEDNTPVKLKYVVYGEAPYEMEFTDPSLILETAAALQSVLIGGESDKNPDNVADAGGDGFYFEMADASSIGFTFMMSTFRWNGDTYHDIADYGDLVRMKNILHDVGYHTFNYIYAKDNDFYTEYYDLYRTEWMEEDNLFGGIRIYTGEEGMPPFVSIRRILGESGNPLAFLKTSFPALLERGLANAGGAVTKTGNVETVMQKMHASTDKELAHVSVSFTDAENNALHAEVYTGEFKDELVQETVLVQFAAVYEAGNAEGETLCLDVLSHAMNRFHLNAYRQYESGDVKPGELLFDFCNDARMDEWYEKTLANPSQDLFIRLPDEDIDITGEPETVVRVILALATIRIGEEATETVGASEPRYFLFIDPETGEDMDIMFHKNQFEYDGTNYVVTDWGELDALLQDLRS